MKQILLTLGIVGLIGALAPTPTFAGGDEVVVVYNSRLPESKSLAEYYAKQRHVPKSQVFGFALTTDEAISRTEFRDGLQKPLAKKFSSAKLWRRSPGEVFGTNGTPVKIASKVIESKIRYAVLCYGIPLKILHDDNHKEPGEENTRAELRRNGAAVDSELALLPVLDQNPALAGPLRSPYYTTTNVALLHPTNGLLLVTRLDGPTPEIARGLVNKALQAESEGLWGRAYFDLRNTTDPGMKQGDDWIRGAAEIVRHLGFETVVDEGWDVFPVGFPMSHIAFYAGWYRESVAGPFTLPKVEFMPGAFAYHLHSFSAASLRDTDRHWAGPLLAKGATCTMGCVDEPYLAATPDVAIFAGRLVFYGFTFGEAAYAGQPALSWQTTVVGDPLYRPFGNNPDLLHQKLKDQNNILIEWSWLRVADINLANGKPVADAVAFLENLEATKQSAVLKEKLADLYAAQGKPSSAALTYQQALKLDPSPQQRIRLRLTLSEKLMALNRDEDAYANYQKFLEESPDYSDLLLIYRKLLPLAQKLGKQDDAAKYDAKVNPPNPTNTNAPAKSQ
jgi:uncharacterized protein (TIGR03790 family)